MLEIIILLLLSLAAVAAARKGRGGRRGISKARFNDELSLGALSGNVLVGTTSSDLTPDEDTFVVSMDVTVGIYNHTVQEGPLTFGVAHSDYSDAEIEQWFENSNSMKKQDLIAQEIAKRKIRTIGQLSGVDTEMVLNDGNPIRVPIRFVIGEAQFMKFWCYNEMNSALTTNTIAVFAGDCWFRRQ